MTRQSQNFISPAADGYLEKKMKTDKTLDIKGLTDQRPQEVTKDVLNMMAKGQILRVIADDEGARRTISMLCEYSGYSLLSMKEDGRIICFIIQK